MAKWTYSGVDFPIEMVVVDGERAYLAGHGPTDGADLLVRGRVGEEVTVDQGHQPARLAGLSMLASLQDALGDLDRVRRWLRVAVYVNATPSLAGMEVTTVGNGVSELTRQVWGDAGRHARVSPGVAALPLNMPVVVEATLAVDAPTQS